jgi:hydroxypyruvate reductase
MTSEFLEQSAVVPARGLVTTPYTGVATEFAHRLEVMKSAHPVPDASSRLAAVRAVELAHSTGKEDVLVVLLSGGGSSLWALPHRELTLDDLQHTTHELLRAGSSIHELNTVRKHLSAIKGGWLAAAAAPAKVVTLIISDVVGDDPSTIASGPTVPDPTTFLDALNVVDRRGGRSAFPAAVIRHLVSGAEGRRPETPKPGEPFFALNSVRVIGSNADALETAAARARALGYEAIIHPRPIAGEAADAGRLLARRIMSSASGRPTCLIWGGETTVTVTGEGRGGRNQEIALSLAIEISGEPRPVVFLSGGTDGIDGPTDAVGACVSARTVRRAEAIGIQAESYLRNNDAHPFFDRVGGLVITGPTGTNVMDVQIALIGA